MDSIPIYTACVLGAAAILVLLRGGSRLGKTAASVVGLGAVAWLTSGLIRGAPDPPGMLLVLFGLLGLASAARLITHPRPVFCALYFVMIVLSLAGVFLLLSAEFMAFALVIVYAGAILVTYLFVLMLAQQAADPAHAADQAAYDRQPREPATATVVGLLVLLLLVTTLGRGLGALPPAPSDDDARRADWARLEALPRQLERVVHTHDPGFPWPPLPDAGGHLVRHDFEGVWVAGVADDGTRQTVRLVQGDLPRNTQVVGWSLVHGFPASLELAGVILLLALFGAVVLARRPEGEYPDAVADDPEATP